MKHVFAGLLLVGLVSMIVLGCSDPGIMAESSEPEKRTSRSLTASILRTP